eukprot:TRINITY_DN27181_c0_g1_i1.p1 TRINITY_DN27181_c0_g1~~TRINITY_DN27181_c0_g1_i1.p1  ORF type:complete len:1236 (-),score=232.82 TRINITY_DN27181_c0_g1_i1:55-3762(-)
MAASESRPAESITPCAGAIPALMDGWLMKRSQTFRWRWRFVQLTHDNRLQTFTAGPPDGGPYEEANVMTEDMDIREEVMAEAADFRIAAPLPFGFMVTSGSKTLRFAAKDSRNREAWLLKLSRVTTTDKGESSQDQAAAQPQPSAAKGSGKGGKGKALPGKAPPPKAPGPKQSAGPKAAAKKAFALPIGRRLAVRGLTGAEAEAFKGAEAGGSSSSRTASDAEGAPTMPSKLNPAAVDLEALRSAFAPKPAKSAAQRGRGIPKPTSKGEELLPRSAAQNVAIVLRKLRLDTDALAAALDRLQPADCTLTPEETQRFLQVLPVPDALRPIAEFPEENISQLRDVERQLRPLALLTRLPQRLRLLMLFKSLDDRLGEAMRQMCSVQSACSAVRRSSVLRNLLQVVLVVFNYVNFGEATTSSADGHSSTPKVRSVDVQSLMRLVETQAYGGPFPKYNMLHYCMKEVLRQCPDLRRDDLDRELGMLPSAASINLAQVKLGVENMQEDLEFVKGELYGHREDYAPPAESEEEEVVNEPAAPEPANNDTDSEEEILPSAASQERSTLLTRLLSYGIDTVSFAEEWRKGTAVLGCADNSLEAVLATDGVTPPPGLLWRLTASARWKQYFCEVRGSLLVLYRIKGSTQVKGTSYVVLPGAEIASFTSAFASERAKGLAAENPHGFELRPSGDSKPEMFRAKTKRELDRWIEFLCFYAQKGGIGFLSVYAGGWGLFSSCWKRIFCAIKQTSATVADEDSGSAISARSSVKSSSLLGYASLRDYAEGAKPECVWKLDGASVRPFDGQGASAAAAKLLRSTPIGLEIQLSTGEHLHLACDSLLQQQLWLDAVQTLTEPTPLSDFLGESGDRARSRAQTLFDDAGSKLKQVDSEELLDLFKEQRVDEAPAMQRLSLFLDEPARSSSSGEQLRQKLMFSVGVAEAGRIDTGHTDEGLKETASDAAEPRVAAQASEAATATTYIATDGGPTTYSASETASDADGGASGTESPEEQPVDALSQLRNLETELLGAVEQWSRSLAATEADCRVLLRFFGLEAPDDAGLASASGQLLSALAAFEGQVAQAWDELEQHLSSVKSAEVQKTNAVKERVELINSGKAAGAKRLPPLKIGGRKSLLAPAEEGEILFSAREVAADDTGDSRPVGPVMKLPTAGLSSPARPDGAEDELLLFTARDGAVATGETPARIREAQARAAEAPAVTLKLPAKAEAEDSSGSDTDSFGSVQSQDA